MLVASAGPCRDADADSQNDTAIQLGVDIVHRFLYPKCRADGAKRVIVVLNGDVKQRHDRIAEQMIDDPVMLSDDLPRSS